MAPSSFIVQLFLFSNVLFLLVSAPVLRRAASHDSPNKQIQLVFDVQTLVHCNPTEQPVACFPSKQALDFLQWARAESLQPSNPIDPQFIAWTDGGNTLEKFKLALTQYQQRLNFNDAWMMEDCNLTRYFSGASGTDKPLIIEGDRNKQFRLLGPHSAKNMMALRKSLALDEVKDIASKTTLLFTAAYKDYKLNVCSKRYDQQNLLPIIIDEFRGEGTDQQNRPRFRSKLITTQFSGVSLILRNLISRDKSQPITTYVLRREFQPPVAAKCPYSLKDHDDFHVALVIDLDRLSLMPVDTVKGYFTNFLQTALPPAEVGAFNALLFLCNPDVLKGNLCIELDGVYRGYGVNLMSHVPLIRFVITSGTTVTQSELLSFTTGLPQRSTLIIQVGANFKRLPDPSERDSSDRPNICYISGRPAGFLARLGSKFSNAGWKLKQGLLRVFRFFGSLRGGRESRNGRASVSRVNQKSPRLSQGTVRPNYHKVEGDETFDDMVNRASNLPRLRLPPPPTIEEDPMLSFLEQPENGFTSLSQVLESITSIKSGVPTEVTPTELRRAMRKLKRSVTKAEVLCYPMAKS